MLLHTRESVKVDLVPSWGWIDGVLKDEGEYLGGDMVNTVVGLVLSRMR